MQIILEALSLEQLRQLRALTPFAELLHSAYGIDATAASLEQLMAINGYEDNNVIRVVAANLAINATRVQLIVKFDYRDDHEGLVAEGKFYITSPESGVIRGEY